MRSTLIQIRSDFPLFCLLSLFLISIVFAKDKIEFYSINRDTLYSKRSFSISKNFALFLIDYYQKHISPKSINRCIFNTSCSNFAKEAIQNDGLFFGSIKFLDRFYYREHSKAWSYYLLIYNSNGLFKLDDDYFLNNTSNLNSNIDTDTSNNIFSFNTVSICSIGDSLFKESDYSNAIYAYKTYLYSTNDKSEKVYCQFQLARSYLAARNYSLCLKWSNLCLNNIPENKYFASRIHRILGLNYAYQKLFPFAQNEFSQSSSYDTTGLSQLYNNWLYAENKYWLKSKNGIDSTLTILKNSKTIDTAKSWRNLISERLSKKNKSPAKAAVLSSIIPGLGQCYSNHFFDGFHAFTIVSLFTLASFASYKYETTLNKPRILTTTFILISSLFYISNIWGAHKTALYRNYRYDEDVLDYIRKSALDLELNSPPP